MSVVIKGRILVVDDDPIIRGWVKRVAEAAGYELSQAADGRSGLEMAEDGRFDLILLDINMASLDGRDVLSRLKSNPATAAVPVLVLSGDVSVHRRQVVIELGGEELFEKPLSGDSLMRKIASLIRKGGDRAVDIAERS